MDLALNNLQRLICHKIQPTNQHEWRVTGSKSKSKKDSCKNLEAPIPECEMHASSPQKMFGIWEWKHMLPPLRTWYRMCMGKEVYPPHRHLRTPDVMCIEGEAHDHSEEGFDIRKHNRHSKKVGGYISWNVWIQKQVEGICSNETKYKINKPSLFLSLALSLFPLSLPLLPLYLLHFHSFTL